MRRPIPAVRVLLPGATDSFVQQDAADAVRLADGRARPEFAPDLVLLATDGLDASRAGRSWHGDVARELCGQLEDATLPPPKRSWPRWCDEAASAGGDDCTMARAGGSRLLDHGSAS